MGILLCSYGKKHSIHNSYLAATIDKHSLLRTQVRPRMVFVGGSAAAFGLDSSKIASACGLHPVNMGLNAFLGLEFMLREVQPGLRRGDVVIVTPEYFLFTKSQLYGSAEVLWRVIEARPANARYFTLHQWREMLDRGVAHRWGTIFRGELASPECLFSPARLEARDIYNRAGFDQYGDFVAHRTSQPRPDSSGKIMYRFQADPVRKAVAMLNQFGNDCSRAGVRVFYSHCPLHMEDWRNDGQELTRLDNFLHAHLRIPMLDTLQEMIFPADVFYDTRKHLIAPGIEKRAALLIQRLQKELLSRDL